MPKKPCIINRAVGQYRPDAELFPCCEINKDPGFLWSNELKILVNSETSFEAISSLRRIGVLLATRISKEDRLTYCSVDFHHAIRYISGNTRLWCGPLMSAVLNTIKVHFSDDKFARLPSDLILDVLRYLTAADACSICEVSSDFNRWCSSDTLWMYLFHARFMECAVSGCNSTLSIKRLYQMRFIDPIVGDKIQAAWNGKFRLNAMEMLRGHAYWPAEIIEKDPRQGYKIRYTGWDADRWDQWVQRDTIRWPVDFNHVERISAGDLVEVWCHGKTVPGAWLCATVSDYDMDLNLYRFDDLQMSGDPLFVRREFLRKVKRPVHRADMSINDVTFPTSMQTYNHPGSCVIC